MSHKDDVEILYDKPIPVAAKQWFNIQTGFRISSFLSPQDIQYLNSIATSIKLSGNPSKKKELITLFMEQRNFKRMDCGTNRIVFKYMEDQSIVVKIAFDRIAINDNLREFKNQEFLKPFCAKCFEVSSCGTVGLFERVHAVKNKEQFLEIADRVFDIIVNCFLGKYVLADFGTNYYKNWGVRKGMCPVILDYPYLYELDSSKLFCNNDDPKSPTGYCGGEIDYDDGFNFLKCEKCGKIFLASELSRCNNGRGGLIVEREEDYMNITIEKNGKKITLGEKKETSTYKKQKLSRREYKMKKATQGFSVSFERGDHSEPAKEEKKVPTPKPLTEHEMKIDRDCESIEVKVTTRDGKEYVGKSIAPPYNPYATIEEEANIYGSGAVFVDNNEEDEVVYSDKDDEYATTNVGEIVKAISNINSETNSVEEPTVEEAPAEEYATVSAEDAAYYETEEEYSEEEIMDEF